MQFGLEFGEHKYLPTSQAIGKYTDFDSKCLKTLNSFYKFKIKKSKTYTEKEELERTFKKGHRSGEGN